MVFLAIEVASRQHVACKVYDISRFPETSKERIRQEAELMSILDHVRDDEPLVQAKADRTYSRTSSPSEQRLRPDRPCTANMAPHHQPFLQLTLWQIHHGRTGNWRRLVFAALETQETGRKPDPMDHSPSPARCRLHSQQRGRPSRYKARKHPLWSNAADSLPDHAFRLWHSSCCWRWNDDAGYWNPPLSTAVRQAVPGLLL